MRDYLVQNLQLDIVGEYLGAKQHHALKCLVCEGTFTATPLSKKQTFIKRGSRGCPHCLAASRSNKTANRVDTTRAELLERGYVVLDPNCEFDYSDKKTYQLQCKEGHVFDTHPYHFHLMNRTCPVCRKIEEDANRVIETVIRQPPAPRPEYTISDDEINTFQQYTNYTIVTKPRTAKCSVEMTCNVCNTLTTSTMTAKKQHMRIYGVNGCTTCGERRRKLRSLDIAKDWQQKLLNYGYEVLSPIEDFRRTLKVQVRNTKCLHIMNVQVNQICSDVNGNIPIRCSTCGAETRKNKLIQYNKRRAFVADPEIRREDWELYRRDVSNASERNIPKLDEHFPRGMTGDLYQVDHVMSKLLCFRLGVSVAEAAQVENLRYLPVDVNKQKSWYVVHALPEYLIQYYPRSEMYQQGVEMLSSEFGSIENCDTNTLVEGIEVHVKYGKKCVIVSDIHEIVSEDVGMNAKRQILNDAGYRVMFLYADELERSTFIVEKLKYWFGLSQAMTVHARNATIKEITTEQANVLYDQSHIQGRIDHASVSYGAFVGDELVAAMSFNKDLNDYQLSRFVVKCGIKCTGIANRLLSAFKQDTRFVWDNVVSYSDNRWSVGDLYHKLGFSLDHINKPSFYYSDGNVRFNRRKFTKKALRKLMEDAFDETVTEHENAWYAGFHRVFDCGTTKWRYRLP